MDDRPQPRTLAEQRTDSLLCFRVGWENEAFAKTAVQNLLYHAKIMGDSNIQNLVTAVTTQGATQTGCCLVARLGIGRAEIGGDYPHLVYVRLWRWPDACKDELRHYPTCKNGYDLNKNLLCVNPYHYYRIGSTLTASTMTICGPFGTGIQPGIVTRAEANSSNIVTESSKKPPPLKIPMPIEQSSSSHETASPAAAETQNSKTPASNLTLSQTLPKDMFSLSCFQSANVAPPSLTASTVLGGASIANSNDATASIAGTSYSQNQANASNVGDVKIEPTNIPQGFVVPDHMDDSLSSNDEYYDFPSRTSTSSSSDGGFEMIDYDEDMKDVSGEPTDVDLSVHCSPASDQAAKNEPTCGESAVKTESDLTSLIDVINGAENTLKATDLFVEPELPPPANLLLINELVDEIPMPPSFVTQLTSGSDVAEPSQKDEKDLSKVFDGLLKSSLAELGLAEPSQKVLSKDENDLSKLLLDGLFESAPAEPSQKVLSKDEELLDRLFESSPDEPSQKVLSKDENDLSKLLLDGLFESAGAEPSQKVLSEDEKLLDLLFESSPDEPSQKVLSKDEMSKSKLLARLLESDDAELDQDQSKLLDDLFKSARAKRSQNLLSVANDLTQVIPDMETENQDLKESKETKKETAEKIAMTGPCSSLSPPEQVDKMMQNYDELQDKHTRIKKAFIEACYVTTHETLAERTEKIQDIMMNLDDIFRDAAGVDNDYTAMKLFILETRINSNDAGTSNNTANASTSTSPTGTPYLRKSLTTVIRRKTNPITSLLKLLPTSGIYDTPLSRTVQRLVDERSNSSSETPATATNDSGEDSSAEPASSAGENKSREPVPRLRLTLKRTSTERSSYVVQKSEGSDSNGGGVSGEPEPIGELKEELYRLRTQVKSLEAQLEMQKQDEVDKMMLYTKNMREQHINTVNRLTKEKETLAAELASKKAGDPLDMVEVNALLDEKDKEIEALNDNLLALSAILTSNDEEILALKNEKRNLKRNSESEELAQEEVPPKRSPDIEGKIDPNEDPITPQHVFDYLCAELEKSNLEKAQEASAETEATSKNDLPPNDAQTEENAQAPPGSSQMETLATSFELCQISEREQAMAAKLNEIIAELEVMKITHVKTKSDLENRLKNGAKQYAKLYVKYDKLVKNNSQPPNGSSSSG